MNPLEHDDSESLDCDEAIVAECLEQILTRLERGLPTDEPSPLELSAPQHLRARIARAKECMQTLESVISHSPSSGSIIRLGQSPNGLPQKTRIGRFHVVKELGSGGFGIVYLAWDPRIDRQIALKTPRLEVLASAELEKRFEQEARATARLDHPHIVMVLEAGNDGMLPYIASVYYPGVTLATWLSHHPKPKDPSTVARLIQQLANALAHAHANNVLHRDIKPSNILLSTVRGDTNSDFSLNEATPRLMDFGLAKLANAASDMTRDGAMLGTIRYMPPEQAAGRTTEIGPASDVYGLGMILYELLVGHPPFQADTDLEVLHKISHEEPSGIRLSRPTVPRDLDTIAAKCLEKDPARRYVTAQALSEELGRFLHGEPILARPANLLERASKWCRRNPQWATLLAVVASALVGCFAMLSYSNLRISNALVAERASRESLQSQLYASDVSRAFEAATAFNNPAQSISLLEPYATQRADGDLREFVWHHLWNKLTNHHAYVPRHPQDVYSISQSPDGTLLATACRDGRVRVWRVATQQVENEFACDGHEVNQVAFSPNGRWLAAGTEKGCMRVWSTSDWSLHFEHLAGGMILADHLGDADALSGLTVQPNGKIVAVGSLGNRPNCAFTLMRFSKNGMLDGSFGQRGIKQVQIAADSTHEAEAEHATSVVLQPDGKIVASGWHLNGSHSDFALVRCDPDGSLDLQFGNSGIVTTDIELADDRLYATALQADGKIVAAGSTCFQTAMHAVLLRYNADGSLDLTFGNERKGYVRAFDEMNGSRIAGLALQADGKIVATGEIRVNGRSELAVSRFDEHGVVDPHFGTQGVATSKLGPGDAEAGGVVLHPDGKIVIVGSIRAGDHSRGVALRFDAHGQLDTTFGGDGTVVVDRNSRSAEFFAAIMQPSGGLLLGGRVEGDPSRDFAVARVHSNGTLDPTFGDHGWVSLRFGAGDNKILAMGLDPSGNIVVGGNAKGQQGENASQIWALARLSSNGTVDSSFSRDGIEGIAFSPDSSLLFAYADQLVQAWDIEQRESIMKHQAPHGNISSLVFSDDFKWFGYASHGEGLVWNSRDLKQPAHQFPNIRGGVRSLLFARDKLRAFVGYTDGTVEVHSLAKTELLSEFPAVTDGPVVQLNQSDDGRLFAARANRNSVHVFRTDNLDRISTLKNPGGRIWDVAFNAQGTALLTGDVEGQVTVWPLPGNVLPVHPDGGMEVFAAKGGITTLEASPDSTRIAVGFDHGAVYLIELKSGRLLRDFHLRPSLEQNLVFAKAGSQLLIAHADGHIFAIDLEGNHERTEWSAGGTINAVALSPQENCLAIISEEEPVIQCRDWPSMHLRAQITPKNASAGLTFSPAGSEVVVASSGHVIVYDVATGKELARAGNQGDHILDIRFQENGTTMLLAEGDHGATLREFPSCRLIATLLGHEHGVNSVAGCVGGRNVASYGNDNVLRIWDTMTGRSLYASKVDGRACRRGLLFTPDGKCLVAAYQGDEFKGRVLLWTSLPQR